MAQDLEALAGQMVDAAIELLGAVSADRRSLHEQVQPLAILGYMGQMNAGGSPFSLKQIEATPGYAPYLALVTAAVDRIYDATYCTPVPSDFEAGGVMSI